MVFGKNKKKIKELSPSVSMPANFSNEDLEEEIQQIQGRLNDLNMRENNNFQNNPLSIPQQPVNQQPQQFQQQPQQFQQPINQYPQNSFNQQVQRPMNADVVGVQAIEKGGYLITLVTSNPLSIGNCRVDQ